MLMMISISGESLSKQQPKEDEEHGPYRKLCNMIHNDYMTMASVQKELG